MEYHYHIVYSFVSQVVRKLESSNPLEFSFSSEPKFICIFQGTQSYVMSLSLYHWLPNNDTDLLLWKFSLILGLTSSHKLTIKLIHLV